MKKVIAIVLVGFMAFSFACCGKNTDTSEGAKDNVTTNQETEKEEEFVPNVNPVELAFHPATSGVYATIKVDSSVKMDDESAWLGLCPVGKDYITELEADEEDVIWFSVDAREKDDDPYVWACDFESVEDGTYALVVATSDDENVGYVAIQLTMVKSGDKLTFDYSDAKLKERP